MYAIIPNREPLGLELACFVPCWHVQATLHGIIQYGEETSSTRPQLDGPLYYSVPPSMTCLQDLPVVPVAGLSGRDKCRESAESWNPSRHVKIKKERCMFHADFTWSQQEYQLIDDWNTGRSQRCFAGVVSSTKSTVMPDGSQWQFRWKLDLEVEWNAVVCRPVGPLTAVDPSRLQQWTFRKTLEIDGVYIQTCSHSESFWDIYWIFIGIFYTQWWFQRYLPILFWDH